MDVTPFPSGAAGPADLVVYYTPGCPFAIRLRVALTFYGVPFTSIRFREDEAAAAKIREVTDGYEISPTVRIGANYLPNPTVDAVRRARRT
jgi:glutaredoxin